MNRIYSHTVVASAVAILAACGGGGGGSSSTTPPPVATPPAPPPPAPAQTIGVSGVVVAGLAKCDVALQRRDGTEVARADAGSDANGRFAFDVPADAGVFVLRASDCSYEDEYTGERITGAVFRAGVTFDESDAGGSVRANISPLSDIALRHAAERAGNLGTLTPAMAEDANERIADLFGGGAFDPSVADPIIATDAQSSRLDDAGDRFGLVLAAISGAGDVNTVMRDVAAGIGDDATLGAEAVDLLLGGALAFEDSGRNASTIPAAEALAPVTGPGRPTGAAPAFMGAGNGIDAVLGAATSVDLRPFFSDTDGAVERVVAAGLPAGLRVEDSHLRGTAAQIGQTELTLTAFDGQGNAASGEVALRIAGEPAPPPPPVPTPDTQAPQVSFSPNNVSLASDETVNVVLSASDDTAVTSGPDVTCTNGGMFAGGVFTAPSVTEDVRVVCTATARDAAGNTGTGTLSADVQGVATPPPPPPPDTEAPRLAFIPNVLSMASGGTGRSNLSASDNVRVTSGPTVSCTNGGMFADGVFTAPVTETDLTSVCTATASDAAGNTGTVTLTVTIAGEAVDDTPPALAFTPASLTVDAEGEASSTLSASDDVGITAGPDVVCTNGGQFANNRFRAPATDTDLTSVCTATASDAAGNIGTASLRVSVKAKAGDTTPPVLSFSPDTLSVGSELIKASTLSASDDVGITQGPNVSCTAGGRFSNNRFTAPKTTRDLTSVCTATARDAAGNEGSATLTVAVKGEEPAPPSAFDTRFDNRAEASRFLSVAGFGDSSAELDALVGSNAEDWLSAQFAKPHQSYLRRTMDQIAAYGSSNRWNASHRVVFWNDVVAGDDPLRHRMTFALSQIVVASEMGIPNDARRLAFYMDAIGQNAFGNYRDLLDDVTYTPAMGQYLTYLGNRKGDPDTGRMPDENYAREILQLFSIGLWELNMDGTPKTRGDGSFIPTYSNDDIVGLARVFTGLTFDETGGSVGHRYSTRMVMTGQGHSNLEKSFLGRTIPANTPGDASVDQALDIIFAHPNVAPFVARQLIQRFTSSHPEPAYVERVATAFETGTFTAPDGTRYGSTGRGDLEATLAAILLDESQHDDPLVIGDTTDIGKVREPVLSFVHFARAFDVSPADSSIEDLLIFGTQDPVEGLGQQAFAAPSVFNFFRPGFIPDRAKTEAGARDLNMPEMQLVDGSLRVGYVNFMTTYVLGLSRKRSGENPDNYAPDFSEVMTKVENSDALADYLDELLLYGRMTARTRATLKRVNDNVPIRPEKADEDRKKRAELAVLIAVTAPEYSVQQ